LRICYFGWGNSSHVFRLVKWFAKRGHEVHLVTDNPCEIKDVHVHNVPSKWDYDNRPRWERFIDWSFQYRRLHFLRAVKWSRNLMRDIKPDIVHCQTLLYPGYLGAFAGIRPYMITPFNGDILWRKEYGRLHVGRRLALRRATYITADTDILLQRCHSLGVKKNRTFRIVNGVDLQRFKPIRDRQVIKRQLGFEGRHIVLNPRGLGDIYNPETVMRTIPIVLNKIPDVLFVFINNAPPKRIEALKSLAAHLGVQDSLSFLEVRPWDSMPSLYQAADVMVSVATSDQSPVSMREAMACGTASLVTDLPGIRDWIRDGENGFLVDPLDVDAVAAAIIELLTDREKSIKMSLKAIETIRKDGDQDVWWKRLERLYFCLINKRMESSSFDTESQFDIKQGKVVKKSKKESDYV